MTRKLRYKEAVFSAEGHMLANETAAVAACEIIIFLDHGRGSMADATAQ